MPRDDYFTAISPGPRTAYFACSIELIFKDSRVWFVRENKELSLKADKMIILLVFLSY